MELLKGKLVNSHGLYKPSGWRGYITEKQKGKKDIPDEREVQKITPTKTRTYGRK